MYKEQFEKYYKEIDNQDKLMNYFKTIEELKPENQLKIYNIIYKFLNGKKQILNSCKKKYISEETKELIKKINYWLHFVEVKKEQILPLKKIIIKNNKEKKELKPVIKQIKNNIKISDNAVNVSDLIPAKQQEILDIMTLELDIISNNLNDIVEAYKIFIRTNCNIVIHWDYILKITNLIIQKMDNCSSTNKKIIINMIKDNLKYQNSYISKDDMDQKDKLKTLQTIWKKISFYDSVKINNVTNNYDQQLKNIINDYNVSKEEAIIIWLENLDVEISNYSTENLEQCIMILTNIKQETKNQKIQEEIKKTIDKNMYIFENYFDIYMMNLEIPKDKKNIIESFKTLIKDSQNNNGENKSYRLFHTILFEEKNLSALKRMLSLEPRFINVKNYNESYLLENLLDLYINQIMNNKYYYLENVFDIYLKYAGIYMTQELKYNLINQIKDTIESYSEQEDLNNILQQLLKKIENTILLENLNINEKEVYTHKKNNIKSHNFKNMLNRTIITIDQNDAKFFENAISCEQLKDGTIEIGVYVSDIVDCLNQDLVIDSKDLKHREYKTEINRYKKYILKEKKVKLAIAFTFKLDEELNVISFNVERARIKVKKNLTLDEAKKILEDGDSQDKLFYILQRMNNIARMLYRKRNPKGHLKKYIDFIPEIQREFTYFANRHIATDSAEKNLNLIYKNQLPKSSGSIYEILDEFYSISDRIEKISELTTSDKVSNYSTINRGNDLFDGSEYTQVTSPTRDLPSLLNQILVINNYIDNEYIKEDQKQNLEKTLMLVNHYNDLKR